MRFTRSLGSLLFAIAILPLASLSAQAPPSSDAEHMAIHVTVSARNGTPVEGLTKNDFLLLDNKHEEPITGFQALSATPTSIVIVLDAVNLPYSEVSYARQQLEQFLSSNGGHLAQPTTLAVLQDRGMQIQPGFTTDGNALRASLDQFSIGLRDLTRAAGFYGATERLEISLTNFKMLIGKLPEDGRKQIIWISAGWPLLSGPGVELSPAQRTRAFNDVVAITTELYRTNTVVDAVNPVGTVEDVGRTNFYQSFLHAPRSQKDVDLGDLGLQVIAEQSGGLVLNGSNDISALIQHSFADSNGGYELTFAPAPGERDNEYHELQVKVRRPGAAVHTTAGYYARPAFPGGQLSVPVPAPR
ncbi:MAG TPA: VWA domain-containing protein [Acidobacteriaceae bacterium]|nr:VWA domain-containing protein [Acidobacteriaceae bacterium]